MRSASLLVPFFVLVAACNHPAGEPAAPSSSSGGQPSVNGAYPPASASASGAPAASSNATTPPTPTGLAGVTIGRPAPDFTLKDVTGKTIALSSFKGKTVVLEWFNPGCPFVARNHTKGPLKDMAAREQQLGVVWLSINSNAPGTQGYGADNNRAGMASFHMVNPVLLDETGTVGHAYGARTTPQMFVIDPNGMLVYRGAIDNAQDGDTTGGKPFVNYVESALGDLAAKRPIATPETQSYGCSVKYQ